LKHVIYRKDEVNGKIDCKTRKKT